MNPDPNTWTPEERVAAKLPPSGKLKKHVYTRYVSVPLANPAAYEEAKRAHAQAKQNIMDVTFDLMYWQNNYRQTQNIARGWPTMSSHLLEESERKVTFAQERLQRAKERESFLYFKMYEVGVPTVREEHVEEWILA